MIHSKPRSTQMYTCI